MTTLAHVATAALGVALVYVAFVRPLLDLGAQVGGLR